MSCLFRWYYQQVPGSPCGEPDLDFSTKVRETTKRIRASMVEEEVTQLMEVIRNASEKGRFSCTYLPRKPSVIPDLLRRVKDMGFTVKKQIAPYYECMWREYVFVSWP